MFDHNSGSAMSGIIRLVLLLQWRPVNRHAIIVNGSCSVSFSVVSPVLQILATMTRAINAKN